VKAKLIFLSAIIVGSAVAANSQSTPRDQPDVSNKTLITSANQDHVMDAAALRKMADDYYSWRNENDPTSSTQAGLHTWDDKLADFSPTKLPRAHSTSRVARQSARVQDR